MNEKDNIKENLINKSEEKSKLLPISKQFFFEDYSNTESIKNSEAFSENDDDTKSDKDINSMRHTNITFQMAEGVPLITVSGHAGHSRTSTTIDIYSHFITSYLMILLLKQLIICLMKLKRKKKKR